jgi:hypothetical protein
MKNLSWALVVLCACAAPPSMAQVGWLESGDAVLRSDLMLLNDAGIIRLPVNQWPMPEPQLRHAMEIAKDNFATNRAVVTALERVRSRLASLDASRRKKLALSAEMTAGESALLRQFGTLGRESLEVSGGASLSSDRFAASLKVTGAADPADDQSLRLDGSYATFQLGNWLMSAHALERFWGPSHESSLILSNNARPMPTVSLERAAALPFESRWLSWLGPWNMSFGVSRMEGEREDIDAPLFMAWRVTVMPFKDIELGFSRTAQFCGKQLECDVDTFFNMLAGNDNVGIDATPENEPGNQMAGFDMRWSSPIGSGPYAVYAQYIGEDESSYLPAKYLGQLGMEVWHARADGGIFQAFAEWADTSCSATSSRGPYLNCAYNQGRFNVEGYRYRGRVIGHTTDRDSTSYALGLSYLRPNGESWSVTARSAKLNRDGNLDILNPVSQLRTDYAAVEFGWSGEVFGDELAVQLGGESIEVAGSERDTGAFGFVRWTHDFSL